MSKRPNIILTIADDQTHQTIGGLNNNIIHTPTLSALAARGTAYTRAQHGGSTHGAVCAPSRAQLHTGKTLFHTSDNLCVPQAADMRRAGDQDRPHRTLGERLRDVGYDTFGVGKWHNGEKSFIRSFTGGSTVFFGGMCPHFCVNSRNLPMNTDTIVSNPNNSGHSTELFTNAAVEFLQTRKDQDKPFFLYVAYTAPHDPRETHYRFRKLYDQRPPVPKNFLPDPPFKFQESIIRDEHLAEFPRDPEEIRMHLADYYAMITHMDEGIGRVHNALAELGLTDDTIVIHTADHGLAVGSHGLMGKQSLYDHSTRVPLLVAGPGFGKGVVDDRLCYQHDLYPTLLNRCDAADETSEYVDLQSTDRRTHVSCSYAEQMRSIRDARHKLIEYNVLDGRRTQLFDTVADPEEITDLSTRADHGSTLESLRGALRASMTRANDPLMETFV